MAKDETKNIITKETIEKELKFLNKADIRSSLVMIAVMAVIFVPLSIIPIYIFFSVGRKTILLGICCFLGFLVFLLPIFLNLISLVKAINEAHLLKKGDWFVDTDEVRYKTEEVEHRHTIDVLYFYRYGRVVSGGVERRHTIDVLYFYRYGRVVSGGAEFQLASQDDAFYLVIYKKKKPSIVLHYSQKMYEYREYATVSL